MITKRQRWKAAGLALVALMFGAALTALAFIYNRDERAVRRELHRLARQFEKEAGSGLLSALADSVEIRGFFFTNAVIQLGRPYPARVTPGELASLAARARVEVEAMQVQIQGVEFQPRPAPDAVELIAAVAVRFRKSGTLEEYLDEYRLQWRKHEGRWRIESARPESAIRPVENP